MHLSSGAKEGALRVHVPEACMLASEGDVVNGYGAASEMSELMTHLKW
jgi:hypothetical protein